MSAFDLMESAARLHAEGRDEAAFLAFDAAVEAFRGLLVVAKKALDYADGQAARYSGEAVGLSRGLRSAIALCEGGVDWEGGQVGALDLLAVAEIVKLVVA